MQTFSIDKSLSFSDIPIFIDANNEDFNTNWAQQQLFKKAYHLNDTDYDLTQLSLHVILAIIAIVVLKKELGKRSIPFEVILLD